MQRTATVPIDDLESLLELACRAKSANVPTLQLYARTRQLIEDAKRRG
jgi:hypothetical protein